FQDDNVIHVANQVNPAADIEVINTELALADLDTVEKALKRIERAAKGNDKLAKQQLAVIQKLIPHPNEAKPVRSLNLDSDELAVIKELCLLTIKPTMYIANVAEDGFENNPLLDQVREVAAAGGADEVSICKNISDKMPEPGEDEYAEFLAEPGIDEPALDWIIRARDKLLGLQTCVTAGVKVVRAWTVKVGATAPQGAGVIH